MRRVWSLSWVGIVYVIVCLTLTFVYISLFGPVFGEWGWLQLTVAVLVLGILVIAAVGALDHQPNPYGRAHPLYNLQDVPQQRSVGSVGFGWITQTFPMVIAVIILLAGSRLL